MNRNQKQSPRFPFITQQLVPIKKSSSLAPQNVSLVSNSKEFANIVSPDKVILLEWAPKPVTGVTTQSHIPERNNTGLEAICASVLTTVTKGGNSRTVRENNVCLFNVFYTQ